jgi:lysophospholipase L1-like esterase
VSTHLLTRRAALAAGVALAAPAIARQPARPRVKVAMVGDSTMASYAKPPADRPDLTGWGQVFGERFTDRVEVVNHAASGRSTKSFMAEGRWKKVLGETPAWVFIQFGHNDQKDATLAPTGGFREYLVRYVDEAVAANIRPVLVTPVARRTFAAGRASTTLMPFADATLAVAREKRVPVIDLHRVSLELYDRLGDERSADLTASATDRTHFSRKGALAIAGLVAAALPMSVPDLAAQLKKE